MKKNLKIGMPIAILSVFLLSLFGITAKAEVDLSKPRGEIRVVESWRPDMTMLGYNVLQNLFEYALDRNELAPSLAVSWNWFDDTTLEVKLRQWVRFSNGEPFNAHAVKFNYD